MQVQPQEITLRRTSPAGRPNPYRTRWATVNGQTFVVEARSLDALWSVSDETSERFADDPDAHIAFVNSGAFRTAFAFSLAEARQQIADWINAEEQA